MMFYFGVSLQEEMYRWTEHGKIFGLQYGEMKVLL